jgi:8-oxo-dGTP diphosphatase
VLTDRLQLLPSPGQAIAAFSGAIVTNRLVLRPVAVDDSDALYAQFNDWEVVRWLSMPAWPQDRGNMDRYVETSLEQRRSGAVLALTIAVKDAPIGLIAWERGDTSSHLGYWIGQAHWGRGYMSEAAAAVCDWIFAATAENAIISGVFEGNAASLRIQRKLGFIETGRSVHMCTPRGVALDHIDTKLTRTMRRVVLERARS